MEILNKILLIEQQNNTAREVLYATQVVNKVYAEWKKTGRRKNAIDLVASSVNRISVIHPDILPQLYDSIIMKLCIIIMRCMDIPIWKPVEAKRRFYKKLYPLIDKLEHVEVNIGTGGTLREIIMTRLSAAITYKNDKNCSVFVLYEPKMPKQYLEFIFKDKLPKKCYRMQALPLPQDFDTLISILEINYKKANEGFSQQ